MLAMKETAQGHRLLGQSPSPSADVDIPIRLFDLAPGPKRSDTSVFDNSMRLGELRNSVCPFVLHRQRNDLRTEYPVPADFQFDRFKASECFRRDYIEGEDIPVAAMDA